MNPGNIRAVDGWMTVSAAAEMCRVSPQTVYNYLKRGDIKSKNRSGKTFVDPEEVKVLAAQRWSRNPVTATTVPVSEANQRAHDAALAQAQEAEPVIASEPATANKLESARAFIEQEREAIRTARADLEERERAIAAERELLDVRELEIIDVEKAFALLDKISAEGLAK